MIHHQRFHILAAIFASVTLLAGLIYGVSSLTIRGASPAVKSAAASDWMTYNYNLANSSDNTAETTLTASNFPKLKVQWIAHGRRGLSAQPVAVGNVVYWGTWDGNLHATTVTGTNAGKDLWTLNLGVTTGTKCDNPRSAGIASTPTFGSIGSTPTLYIGGGGNNAVGGGNVYLYAINATTGTVTWKTRIGASPGGFAWSSPVLYNGSVYYSLASLADCPLVRGLMVKLDAATGQQQAIMNMVPASCVGGGIWGSPAIDTATGNLYIAVGSPGCSKSRPGDFSTSLLELKASDLSPVAFWRVPSSQQITDGDFGSAPTLFNATINGTARALVGIANKNGIFYALDSTNVAAGPVWEQTIAGNRGGPQSGQGSISPAAWDGQTLYVAGGNTTIGGTRCKGSVRALNPATGAFKWEHCMTSGPILGSLAAVPGVVVAATGSMIVALNTAGGQTLFTYHDPSGKVFWAPASIANGHVFAGNMDSSLVALGL